MQAIKENTSEAENFPNTELQHYLAMLADINHCRICKCPRNTHVHINYELHQKLKKVVDSDVDASI
uniref:Zf-RVT domain-containing protein n=1 Tax=Heterorhabditis bacteriophora TaxID=37862 RepID=A0A1I7XNJ4_HETBA